MKKVLKTERFENGMKNFRVNAGKRSVSLLIERGANYSFVSLESATISFCIHAFTLKRFVPFSNRSVFKIIFILCWDENVLGCV